MAAQFRYWGRGGQEKFSEEGLPKEQLALGSPPPCEKPAALTERLSVKEANRAEGIRGDSGFPFDRTSYH